MLTNGTIEQAHQVKLAAIIFARMTTDPDKIAAALHVTPDAIECIMERPDFDAELDALGYRGNRKLCRRTDTHLHQDRDRAKGLWEKLYHLPLRKRPQAVADELGISILQVRLWMRDWQERDPDTDGDATDADQ